MTDVRLPRPAPASAPLTVDLTDHLTTSPADPDGDRPVVTDLFWPTLLGAGLAVSAATASAVSLFAPSILLGPAVSNGNLRGTALTVLVVAVPLLVLGMLRTAAGSARGLVLWLGSLVYLTYQAVLFCFGTPMNENFLLYVAWLGLAVWSLGITLWHADVDAWVDRTDGRVPVRALAAVLAVLAGLNALAWLARIVPAVTSSTPGAVLEGSGMTTSPVWVQDLAVWIPAALAVAVIAWRRHPWGTLLLGTYLCFEAVEALGIGVDQWFGARADATHPDLASTSAVVPCLVLAGVLAVLTAVHLRHVEGTTGE